jgi:putative nucleotidyltransferase with HDIG domain
VSSSPAAQPAPRRPGAASTNAYVAAVVVFAVALVVLGWRLAGRPDDLVAVAVLCGMGATSWVLRDRIGSNRINLSFTSIILLAAAVIVGPVGAAAVGALAPVAQVEREKVVVRVFNIALFSAMGCVGGLAYLLTGGDAELSGATPGDILLHVGLPLIIANVSQCLVNAALLSGVLRFATGTPFRTQVLKLLGTTGVGYLGYGVIGFLFVVLWIPAGVGWFSAVLVLAPLFVARWAFVQYGDEVRVHERTLKALVTAVETKEPHNAGHSQRVADLSEWLAEALGLGYKEVQDVRSAGMLHDVGKVALPARTLRPRTPLGHDDLVVLADHARRGVDMVDGIDFLKDSFEGIAHHHERWDGQGYPAGLAGQAIPLAARIVAVADVFDALTSARAYRPARTVDEAVAIITARAGTQFDPTVVEALPRALARHEWRTTERSEDVLLTSGVGMDHDEPEMSDLFADQADLRRRVRGAARPPATPAAAHREAVGGMT